MPEQTITKTLLVVSVNADFADWLEQVPASSELETLRARTNEQVISWFDRRRIDIVFLDFEKYPPQEINLVDYIKRRSPHTEVVVFTTIQELDMATTAMRSGAALYLIKPVASEDLQPVLNKLAARLRQGEEYLELENRVLNDLMTGSAAMEKVMRFTRKIAPTNSTVLIGGESGTGKEFQARIIHRLSQRREGSFVAMNCGAVPDTLFESELFGHRKGAFTGADRDKPGLVEEANLGTLFLDEVGELSAQAQVKLLRFLQERTFRRVGETSLRSVNVRIIAASNKDLARMVVDGTFREDLYYRINVFYLYLPPLRERKESIPNMVRLFVHRHNAMLGKKVNKISKAAEVMLANYDYPGNVRELENIIEHATVLAENGEITEHDLPEAMFRNRLLLDAPHEPARALPASPTPISGSVPAILPLEELEKRHIEMALRVMDHNYTEIAKKLGVSRSTLWRKIKAYGLEKKS
jgi:two-component system nitrogen regulation response regulator GlnG/two-component system response regulator HydG